MKTDIDANFQAISRHHLNFEIQILLERDYQNDSIKIKAYSETYRCYLNTFLTAKSMIIKNLEIQMLAGNSLKMCVGVSFEISLTLGSYILK